jgi:hypothetical protein
VVNGVAGVSFDKIVEYALTDVVECRLQPLIHYVKLVTRRRTNAREGKMKSRESAPNVIRKLLVGYSKVAFAIHATKGDLGRQFVS